MKHFFVKLVLGVAPFILTCCKPEVETETVYHEMNEAVKTDVGLVVTVTDITVGERAGWGDFLVVCLDIQNSKGSSFTFKSPPYNFNLKAGMSGGGPSIPTYYTTFEREIEAHGTLKYEVGFDIAQSYYQVNEFRFIFFKTKASYFFDDSFHRYWVLPNPLKA